MAKFKQRENARKLRKRGTSIKDIAKKLNVSRSSASVWCSDMSLTKYQKEKLWEKMIKGSRAGRMAGAESNKKKKIDEIQKQEQISRESVGNLTRRDLMFLGTALFWGEGSKTSSRLLFVNSDVQMMKVIIKFLQEVMGISKDRLRATVQINEVHKPRIKKVLKFWSNELDIPSDQFNKPYYIKIKPKKRYDNHSSYHGILRLLVTRGTSLQYRMLGFIKAVSNKI